MIVKSPWPSVKPIPEIPAFKLIEDVSRRLPEKTAIIFTDGRIFTYKELANHIDAFARALVNTGVEKGDVVAIDMPNCPEYVIAFHGCLKAGATVTTMNPLYKEREVR